MSLNPYVIPFRNDSGESIPAFAVMRPKIEADSGDKIVDRSGNWVIPVKKPDTKFSRRYLINGPSVVTKDGYGMAADGIYPVLALREDETVECGDGWGVQPSSWKLKRYSPGKFTLYSASGEKAGNKRGLFSQVECNELIVNAADALTCGGSVEVAALLRRGLPATTATTIEIMIRDMQFSNDVQYPANTTYKVSWLNGAWYVDWFDKCPVVPEV